MSKSLVFKIFDAILYLGASLTAANTENGYLLHFSMAAGGSVGHNKEKEQKTRGRRVASWEWILEDVVINTGPHYSLLHMAPANDDQLIKSYEIVIKKVYNFLSAPPVPTLTFFCATSPVHQNCGAYSQPVLSNSSVAKNPSPEWHMFPELNRIAKKFFADQNSTTTRYLDIWPLSVQRPDAHTGWHKDQLHCLHVGTLVVLRLWRSVWCAQMLIVRRKVDINYWFPCADSLVSYHFRNAMVLWLVRYRVSSPLQTIGWAFSLAPLKALRKCTWEMF
ncbi:uncharacterized protein LACBIDRAFT_328244 [Laccaria bicolor S238N-H82]|uniref:Predicted protein n=1 Tax=Laccaria bicolor (strain S238N-H82 / ATCC MYA-4686) TaxID=486041 RepID=B0DEB1_LACBS|nr:uncharacterized protein LACBIDRAFT_328244 [Laccaria bicolor S238N-H82]EDR06899.1 predicted protein [Laccaria bicolor S238N-H82]|eukprot:XP_001882272.1 predicted protein [Laccaria bicolor S238N-H82]